MIEALKRRFPDQPPYGGASREIVPHLTIAQSEFDARDRDCSSRGCRCSARAERAALLEQRGAGCTGARLATIRSEDA